MALNRVPTRVVELWRMSCLIKTETDFRDFYSSDFWTPWTWSSLSLCVLSLLFFFWGCWEFFISFIDFIAFDVLSWFASDISCLAKAILLTIECYFVLRFVHSLVLTHFFVGLCLWSPYLQRQWPSSFPILLLSSSFPSLIPLSRTSGMTVNGNVLFLFPFEKENGQSFLIQFNTNCWLTVTVLCWHWLGVPQHPAGSVSSSGICPEPTQRSSWVSSSIEVASCPVSSQQEMGKGWGVRQTDDEAVVVKEH